MATSRCFAGHVMDFSTSSHRSTEVIQIIFHDFPDAFYFIDNGMKLVLSSNTLEKINFYKFSHNKVNTNFKVSSSGYRKYCYFRLKFSNTLIAFSLGLSSSHTNSPINLSSIE